MSPENKIDFIRNHSHLYNEPDPGVQAARESSNRDGYLADPQNLPSDSGQLILDVMIKRLEEEKKLKEKKIVELGSRAKHHENFSEYYSKISREFKDKAEDENLSAQEELQKSQVHEKESIQYSSKAKEMIKKAWDQESKEICYVNNYRRGYSDSNVANIKSVGAAAIMKNLEGRAKYEYVKSTQLQKLANLLENEAEDYEEMGRKAEENALKENSTSEMKENIAKKHYEAAEQHFFKKVVDFKRRAKEEYFKYLEYLLKNEREQELAREEQLKAAYEIKLTNAYVQKAQQNSAFASVARSRLSEDRLKAKESAAGLYRPRDAEILVASKVFQEKSVKVV